MKRLVLLSLLCMSASVAAFAAARPGPLDAEERLAKKLDLHVVEEPLAELVAQVARETGAPLATSEDTADERITLLAHERPARELLDLAAKHLDYSWTVETRKGVKTFVLIQDAAAKKREEALRGGPLRDLTALKEKVETQGRLIRSATAQAAQPRETRLNRLEQIDERLRGRLIVERMGDQVQFRREPGPRPMGREREELEREQSLLQAATPESYGGFNSLDVAARVYARLGEEQRAALWQGMPVRFAYPPEPERVALGNETAIDLAAEGIGNVAHRVDEATGREYPVPLRGVERVRGDLWLERRGVEIRLQVRARILGSTGDDQRTNRAERVFSGAVQSGRGARPPRDFPRLDEATAALRDPVTLPAETRKPTSRQGETTRFPEVLEKLAARLSYPIIADGYTTGVLVGPLITEQKPLSEVLARLCLIFDRTCRLEDGYLQLRHRDWATRRAMEPPARKVKAWEQRLTDLSALPLAELVDAGGKLTEEQRENLLVRWRGRIPEGAYWLLDSQLKRGAVVLRLLASLPAASRRTLDAGRALQVRSLPPASRLPLWQSLLAPLERIRSYEALPQGENQPSLGAGFAAEDRLEAAWGQATLAMRRQPAAWLYTSDHYYAVEQLDQALTEERAVNPKATEKDLRRVEGEQVEVLLTLPGDEPARYVYLVALPRTPGD